MKFALNLSANLQISFISKKVIGTRISGIENSQDRILTLGRLFGSLSILSSFSVLALSWSSHNSDSIMVEPYGVHSWERTQWTSISTVTILTMSCMTSTQMPSTTTSQVCVTIGFCLTTLQATTTFGRLLRSKSGSLTGSWTWTCYHPLSTGWATTTLTKNCVRRNIQRWISLSVPWIIHCSKSMMTLIGSWMLIGATLDTMIVAKLLLHCFSSEAPPEKFFIQVYSAACWG